ncbi:hypothetical protein VPH35_028220 [Triticum aestivum]|uniref:Uncharacterized protein n=1 Tax=Triticum turgidum subsp. durum TaxID=4567 RepID=A0A9R1NPF5_TRITD|nr:unnamed protein product [Triticum turgidum subsp. durum]VAH44575.1 unnamed protein product [Triticum turgidum subsp. durum]
MLAKFNYQYLIFSSDFDTLIFCSFVSLFKDEYKLPKGSVIELSRESNHVLKISIEGEDVGSIQNKLLCQSILDLYIGDDPFDKNAKNNIQGSLASILKA